MMSVNIAKEQDEVDSRSIIESVSSSSSLSSWTAETKTAAATEGGDSSSSSLLNDQKVFDCRHRLHNLEVEVVNHKQETSLPPVNDEVDRSTRTKAEADQSSPPNKDIVLSTVPSTGCRVTDSNAKKNRKKKRDIFVGLKTKYGKKKSNKKCKSRRRSRTSSLCCLSSGLFQDSIMKSWKRTTRTKLLRSRSRKWTTIRKAARFCALLFVSLVLVSLVSSLLFNIQSFCARSSYSFDVMTSTPIQVHQDQDIEYPRRFTLPANSMLKGLLKRRSEMRELEYYVAKHQTFGPKRKSFFSL